MLPTNQYRAMRAILRCALSGNYPGQDNPSDAEVLSFFGQVATDSIGTPVLSPPQQSAMHSAARVMLSSNLAPSNPSDSDVTAFFWQVVSDSFGSAQLASFRYRAILSVLRGALSLNSPGASNPTLADVLAYFAAVFSPAFPFPGSVAPSVWFDGRQQAYSDAAGTIPVSAGLIRRINEGSPLTGVWTSPSDAERPLRDDSTLRFDLKSTGGSAMTRPSAAGLAMNAVTLVVSFVARDSAFAGNVMGLFESLDANVGIRLGGSTVWGFSAAGNWFTSLNVAGGYRNTIVMRFTPTGIDALLNANGTISTDSTSVTLASTPLAASWRVGLNGSSYQYGGIVQAFVVNRAISDNERLAVADWAHTQSATEAYPTDRPLVLGIGDSITRGTQATYNLSYLMLAIANARSTVPLLDVCNVAVGGTGVTGLLQPISQAQSLVLRGDAFYSSARAKNIAVWLLGSNDAANGNSLGYILNGTGGAAGSGIYPAMAYMRSRGWKNILLTLGPRTDATAISNNFESKRIAVNNDFAANWRTYADAFVDTRGITNFGGATDSNNPTYYSADLIHPIDAGHALIEPAVRAAILSLM